MVFGPGGPKARFPVYERNAVFLARSTMTSVAPSSALYGTKNSQSNLDYFIASRELTSRLQNPRARTFTHLPSSAPALPEMSWHQTAAVVEHATHGIKDALEPLTDQYLVRAFGPRLLHLVRGLEIHSQ